MRRVAQRQGGVITAGYDDADLRYVDGMPVLAGARLVLDCCAAMPADSALAVADAALTRGLTGPEQLRAELRRRRGRPGARVAGLVVDRAAPGPQSWFESMSRWWLLEAGLPRPQLQVPFPTGTGDHAPTVDMWFAGQRTVGEADGQASTTSPARCSGRSCEDWLRDTHGVEVVRWVPREMGTPARRGMVVARFHRAFARGLRTA
jgi:hypothetical protein